MSLQSVNQKPTRRNTSTCNREFFYFTIGACGADRSTRRIFSFSGSVNNLRYTLTFSSKSFTEPQVILMLLPDSWCQELINEALEALIEIKDSFKSLGISVKSEIAASPRSVEDAVTVGKPSGFGPGKSKSVPVESIARPR